MLLLVALTGGAGLGASLLLLRAGLSTMWVRYLVAFGIAYLVFLMLLWLWLRTRTEDYADFPDLSADLPSPTEPADPCTCYAGRGGDFGGGGAHGSFDGQALEMPLSNDTADPVSEALASTGEAEELAAPLIVLVLLGALLLSSLLMIYSAPSLFAELLVDGVLSASLYRRLRGLETRHWLETALHRTARPFMLAATIVAVSGWAMALYVPEAHSLGEVLLYLKAGH